MVAKRYFETSPRAPIIGAALTVVRLLKCTPLHPGGHDPVPPRRTPRCTRITA